MLVTGAGGKEIVLLGTKHDDWLLTGMDTSQPMLDLGKRAQERHLQPGQASVFKR